MFLSSAKSGRCSRIAKSEVSEARMMNSEMPELGILVTGRTRHLVREVVLRGCGDVPSFAPFFGCNGLVHQLLIQCNILRRDRLTW